MSNYGTRKLGGTLTFVINTHDPSDGSATDATGSPSFRVYEDEVSTAIQTGSMSLLDTTNTTGYYSEQLSLTSANGYEYGKSYNVYIEATVAGITATTSHNFKISEYDTHVDGVVRFTATTGGTTTSIVCSAVTPAGGDDFITSNTQVQRQVLIVTGSRAGESCKITDYDSGTTTITLHADSPLTGALASGDIGIVL